MSFGVFVSCLSLSRVSHGAPYLPGAPSSAETTRQFLPRGSAGNDGNFLEKRSRNMQKLMVSLGESSRNGWFSMIFHIYVREKGNLLGKLIYCIHSASEKHDKTWQN